jgi:uncharacterized Zn-finger protein
VKNQMIGVLSGILFVLPVASHARALICPFTDHIKISAPKAVSLLSLHAETGLLAEKVNSTAFDISCAGADTKSSHYVYVDIGYNADNKCSVKLKDGPYELSPTIESWHCDGEKVLRLMGLEHDRIFSYDYTLTFTA